MGKIFVPVTGPSESKKAINYAVNIAKLFNLELVVINVIDKESLSKLERYRIFVEEESALFKEDMKKDAEKYLNYAKKLAEQANVNIITVLLEGDPFTLLQEYINNDPDKLKFVCIAKRNETEIINEIFGSIEKKLITRTNFNIIIVGEQ